MLRPDDEFVPAMRLPRVGVAVRLVYAMSNAKRNDRQQLRPRHPTETSRAVESYGSLQLPADLREAAIGRLRAVALLYAAAFFLASVFPNAVCQLLTLVTDEAICHPGFFTTFRLIGPPVLSIAVGLGVYAVVRWGGMSSATKLKLGLAFEVVGSLGIALAEYQEIISAVRYVGMEGLSDAGSFGLSWVSVWVMLFTVVVPTPPRRAVAAAALSVATVPVAFGYYSAVGITTVSLGPPEFFFALVFPYVIVLGMAGIAARVVFGLGTEVRRARELGSYRLTDRLGAGGMGEVWRAEHRLLARPAAVKLIRPEKLGVTDPELRRVSLLRFEREAQTTASLRCPHTVELYDFGIADDGTFYYVMELLDGFDLETLVTRFGPLPPERIVYLLRQICHSLGEAHDVGLIHRDVKPANVFSCRLGRETDWVKVLDFGMVKRHGPDEVGDAKLTAEHVVGGTPGYMAPEQAVGDPVDGRADLYALGCVAYWLLTGEQVFGGRTPVETMMQHVNATPVPPSRRTELSIPPDLEAAVMACLAKRPDERPQTADELARRLAAIRLARPWDEERARAWWEAHHPRPSPA
jgi:serine/threonine-protein kinase